MSSSWITRRHPDHTARGLDGTIGRRLAAGLLVGVLGVGGLLLAAPTPTSATGALLTAVNVNDRWDGGYCATAQITNPTTTTIDWRVTFPIEGIVDQSWNATATQSGADLTAEGDAAWNDEIAPGATYSQFGFCARTTGTSPPTTTTPAPTTTAPSTSTTTPPTGDDAIRPPLSTRGADIVDADGDVVDSAWDPRVLLTLETRMEHGKQQWWAAEVAEVSR